MNSAELQSWLHAASVRELRERLTLGDCSLLRAAIAGEKIDFALDDDSWSGLRKKMQVWERKPNSDQKQLVFEGFPLLESRVQLIQGVQRGFDADQEHPGSAQSVIQKYLEEIAKAWDYLRLPKIAKLDHLLFDNSGSGVSRPQEPSFMSPLSAKDANLAEILRRFGRQHGWSHPGLQIAGETLVALLGDSRKPEFTVRTKILFAFDSLVYPRGIIADLTIERLSEGCGMLIPDAFKGGYLWMREGSFENGLQNARLAALEYLKQQTWSLNNSTTYDWRWRMDDLCAATELFKTKECHLTLAGRSAEVAIACAMIAAARGNPDNAGDVTPLDRNFAATARLRAKPVTLEPNARERMQLSDDLQLPLDPVASVKTKTIVFLENIPLGELERERLAAVVVAEGQNDSTLPNDPRFQFPKATTLSKAYELLVRFPRITRGVNQSIARHCTEALEKYCTPYIAPDIANTRIWKAYRERNPKDEHLKDMPPPKAILTPTELQSLETGNLIPSAVDGELDGSSELESPKIKGNRVFIEAESGQGKSMFLLRCQQTIAQDKASEFLPVRFGRTLPNEIALSQVGWEGLNAEKLLGKSAIAQHLAAYARQLRRQNQSELGEVEQLDWMKWMLRHGRVVFLLDALDQTLPAGVYELGPKLSETPFDRCPAIMTGRPEAKFSREASQRGPGWENLCLVPFEKTRWNRYLGTREIESTIDEAILRVPLLLSMLKPILAQQDKSAPPENLSRQQLYDQSVSYLIAKGHQSEERAGGTRILPNETAVRNQLGEIAWWMVHEQGFVNDVRNDPENDQQKTSFDDLVLKFGLDLVEELDTIDITTARQLIEPGQGRKGLSFRHRSFLEYFFAWHVTRYVEVRTGLDKERYPTFSDDQLLDLLQKIYRAPLNEHGVAQDDPKFWTPGDWGNTLRFLLSFTHGQRLQWLAIRLIELGDPWLVYRSLIDDRLELPAHVECLVRWLVHRDRTDKFGFAQALSPKDRPSVSMADARQSLKDSGLNLEVMLQRSTRDAAWLSPLRDLGCDLNGYYVGASQESLLLDRMTCLPCDPKPSTWNFLDSFVSVSSGTFNISDYEHQDNSRKLVKPKLHKIPDFYLADFPVTNALFELFCPAHRRWRDPYSDQDDQPAIYITWYMATEFCHWLSALTGQTYRLPSEWQWEWACRWLCGTEDQHRHDDYWWGPEMGDRRCWYEETSHDKGTRSRMQAMSVFADGKLAHPSWQSREQCGLLDTLGNVWEWCDSFFDEAGSYRVHRGGSWSSTAWFCRSAYRAGSSPGRRSHNLGFRVSLVPSSK